MPLVLQGKDRRMTYVTGTRKLAVPSQSSNGARIPPLYSISTVTALVQATIISLLDQVTSLNNSPPRLPAPNSFLLPLEESLESYKS